jgi:hypothetical protein
MPAYQRDVALAQEWAAHCGPPLCTRVVLRWRVREHFYEWSSSEEVTAISGDPRTRAILSDLACT